MIFRPVTILLLLALLSSTTSVKWQKKLNTDIFPQHENQKSEEEGCSPGFFCMFFEDDVLEEDPEVGKNYEDEKIRGDKDKVEYNIKTEP